MKILVTGAAGTVGQVVCRQLQDGHELRRMDIAPLPDGPGETVEGTVTDWDTACRAVDGMDGVVHMAIHNPGRGEQQTFPQYMRNDVDVSILGTDYLLAAAVEAGVGRFVFTSSLNVYSARWPQAGQFQRDSDETLAREHYGTMKWLAEELCRYYAQCHGLSTVVLRFNTVTSDRRWRKDEYDKPRPEVSCTRVHIEDVARAVRLAVEKPDIPWGRCLISGANPEVRYDTSTAEKLIGFGARYGFETGQMYLDGQPVDVE